MTDSNQKKSGAEPDLEFVELPEEAVELLRRIRAQNQREADAAKLLHACVLRLVHERGGTVRLLRSQVTEGLTHAHLLMRVYERHLVLHAAPDGEEHPDSAALEQIAIAKEAASQGGVVAPLRAEVTALQRLVAKLEEELEALHDNHTYLATMLIVLARRTPGLRITDDELKAVADTYGLRCEPNETHDEVELVAARVDDLFGFPSNGRPE